MALRNSGAAVQYPFAAIQAFWAWWNQASPRVEEAIDTGRWGGITEEMLSQVHAIDPNLAWLSSPGRRARHALCVSPEGNPALRTLTERWRRAGPPDAVIWEYHPARPAIPGMLHEALGIGGRLLDPALSRLHLSVDELRQVVDVGFFHPAFPELSEDARLQVVFLVLDGLLGEDGVAGWIGEISLHTRQPRGAVPADALPDMVSSLAERHAEPTWALVETADEAGRPVHLAARRPLKRVHWPLLDLHAHITIVAESIDESANSRTHQRVHGLEDDLLAAVGGHALLAVVETHGDKRVLHLYCDSQSQAPKLVEEWRTVNPAAAIAVSWTPDPGWEAVRRYR